MSLSDQKNVRNHYSPVSRRWQDKTLASLPVSKVGVADCPCVFLSTRQAVSQKVEGVCAARRLKRRDAHIPVNSLPESSPAVPHRVGSGPAPSRRFGACSVSDSTDLFWLIYCRVWRGEWVRLNVFINGFYDDRFVRDGSGLCCVLSVCLRVEYLWLMPSCRIANIVWVDTKCYNHLYFSMQTL